MMNDFSASEFKLPILTYHSIDDSGSVISTAPQTFRRQMQILSASSCKVVSLDEVAAAIRERRALPPRAVALTFDDGYRNVYTEAFPTLAQYGFTATVFLITEYCGRDNAWPGQGPGIERAALLAWPEIAEMSRAGIEFGSHTATHPDLTRISPERAGQELKQSKAMIEDRLGRPVTAFAYPYGKHNAAVRELVSREFQSACSTRLGKTRHDCDPHLLTRVDMYYFSNLARFGSLAASSGDWYLGLRRALRGLKSLITG